MEDLKLVISPSPHVRDTDTTEGIMVAVLISLIPVLAAAVYFFGLALSAWSCWVGPLR